MNYKKFAALLLSLVLLMQITLLSGGALAEETKSTQDEANELLQKGLTIFEIDKEVARLNEQDAKIGEQIKQNEQDIVKQNGNVDATRKHAGSVLRAYYTGDRDSIWTLLFAADSFSDVLRMFEYLQMIITNDHRSLAKFTESFQKLTTLQTELAKSQTDLQVTKDKFLQQRQRLVTLQEELDKQLAVSAQAQVIADQIKSLNDHWKQDGLPLARDYLDNLSMAFRDLPQFLMKDNKYINLTSKTPTINLTDIDFNAYLHSKSELLQTLNFEFNDGSMVATGKKNDLQIAITGNFTLLTTDGMNEVRFVVNNLEFNEFKLPDTTIADFSKEFQLGFIPKKVASFLDVTSVETKKGVAVVKLKLSL
jgi:peptidoglycan hydrolase CwlO-like protein